MLELLIGLVIVVVGAELLAKAADGIAVSLKQAYVVGAVLLALSGNLPELAVSVSAILRGQPDLAISSIVGSVAVNILIVMGLSALLGGRKKDLEFESKKLQADLPLLVGALGFFLFINLGRSEEIHMVDGVILLFTYLLLLGFMLYSHKELYVSRHDGPEESTRPLVHWAALFVFSAALIAVGAEMLVASVEEFFIDGMGLDERFVGFTFLALAANLPEHLAAIKAAIKGNGEIAVGNAIGSASQAIYLILGLLIVVSITVGDPLPTHFDTIYLSVFGVSVLLTAVIVNDGRLTWFEGWVCLVIYALAAVSLFYP